MIASANRKWCQRCGFQPCECFHIQCEGITASGKQCKCWAVIRVNQIPYCLQHGNKELALAAMERKRKV